MSTKKLEWEDKYSVGVAEIDKQHQLMFATINELLEAINTNSAAEYLDHIIKSLVEYKTSHFATEEKYFQEFNYEGAAEHIAEHQDFNNKLTALQNQYAKNTTEFAFALVDFLEDWLINHLLDADQKYKECFLAHGLK